MTERSPATTTASELVAVLDMGASAVRRYDLSYKTSAATGRSLLQAVRLCAGATCGAVQLPPTTFEYEEAKAAFPWLRAYTDGQGHFTQAATKPTGWAQLGEEWSVEAERLAPERDR